MTAPLANPMDASQQEIRKIHYSSSYTIIIADDDCDDSDILKSLLTEISPQSKIFCFTKAQEVYLFLDVLKQEELPNLIIIDFFMPPTRGLDILDKLKENRRFGTIPKIIYSGQMSEVDYQKCIDAGATTCLQKTFYLDKLRDQSIEMLSYCK